MRFVIVHFELVPIVYYLELFRINSLDLKYLQGSHPAQHHVHQVKVKSTISIPEPRRFCGPSVNAAYGLRIVSSRNSGKQDVRKSMRDETKFQVE